MKGLLINFDELYGFNNVVLQMNSRHHLLVEMIIEWVLNYFEC